MSARLECPAAPGPLERFAVQFDSLSPCVRLDVASDFSRIIRTAMTFHAQKTLFILLPRFQGAGPAQSAASR